MVIRPLQPDEALVLRDVRLRALDDAPEAFGLTRFEAAALSMEHWRRMVRAHTAPGGGVIFLADGKENGQTSISPAIRASIDTDENTIVGLIAVRRDQWEAGRAHIGQLWVAPQWRRVGLGVALATATVYWAKRQPITELLTWVEQGGQAGRIFERAGFVYTGKRFPQPGAPLTTLCELRCELFQPEKDDTGTVASSTPSSAQTEQTTSEPSEQDKPGGTSPVEPSVLVAR
jgi:GNAT superfamily N-acetyltransferase